jgi:hypothetical protein
MDDPLNISKPQQGVKTLVSELSILRLEKTITTLEEMRSKSLPEQDIRDYIESRHKELDDRTKKKIYQLSFGLTPKDDLTEADLSNRNALNETTLELHLREPSDEFVEMSLLFFEGKRWVVVEQEEKRLVLKQI